LRGETNGARRERGKYRRGDEPRGINDRILHVPEKIDMKAAPCIETNPMFLFCGVFDVRETSLISKCGLRESVFDIACDAGIA